MLLKLELTHEQIETLGSVLMAAHKMADAAAIEAGRNNKRLTCAEQHARASRINEIMKLMDSAL